MKDQAQFLLNLSAMLGTLARDMTLCEEQAQLADASPSWRRLYVRAAFASMEGLAFFLKQHALNNRMIEVYDSFKTPTPDLPIRDLSLLLDEHYTLDDKGTPQTRKAKLPTVPNLLFALAAFAKAVGSPHKPNASEGKSVLAVASAVRDAITHPRDPTALNVTEEDVAAVRRAFNWIRHELTQIIVQTPGVTIEEVEMANKRVEAIGAGRAEASP